MTQVQRLQAPTIPALIVESDNLSAVTVTSADFDKWLRLIGSAPITVQADPATSDYIGKIVYLRNESGGQATVSPGAGVTLNGLLTFEDGEAVSLILVDVDTYDVVGGTS